MGVSVNPTQGCPEPSHASFRKLVLAQRPNEHGSMTESCLLHLPLLSCQINGSDILEVKSKQYFQPGK